MIAPLRTCQNSFRFLAVISVFAIATLLTPTSAVGQRESFLHSFPDNSKDGAELRAGFVMDASGNLFSTTTEGGAAGIGTVFELSPRTGGGWTERVLYSFENNGEDGAFPTESLIMDSSGNLYGTTYAGGFRGEGTVFELSPKLGGGWTEKILHSFKTVGNDGLVPWGGLIMDSAGNLYGSTVVGGASNMGAVFELSPSSGATWAEKILFSFNGSDGYQPWGALVSDSLGNLYGTTEQGGAFGYGTVFELSFSSGAWSEIVLHSFNNDGTDPISPQTGLTFDSLGNLYGTAPDGAAFGGGAVFELTPGNGGWTYSIIYAFNFNNNHDGINPQSTVIVDPSGNLYGTTGYGGTGACTPSGCGTVFMLTPSGGTWAETILHNFAGSPDGSGSVTPLIRDASGNLYGTAIAGGVFGHGLAFEIKP
jgi:uncharacterized repeat protein (TIGR03803 family)